MDNLLKLHREIIRCERCPRLRSYCNKIAREKKPEFKAWAYWGKPVPGFGDPKARLWILGLAPAAHGANRTGRMFTGDSSGKWLFRALYKHGFCNHLQSISRDDGMRVTDAYISAVARCAPPDNKPLPTEIVNCQSYLEGEYRLLKNVRLILCTGAIAFRAAGKLLEHFGVIEQTLEFKHGAFYEFGGKSLLASYHPSRQNTQTGRLTEKMWNEIFERASSVLDR